MAVIGAGNTAMDAVRSSIRLGAEEAHIVYRRSEKEMGARAEDYHRAIEEGAIFDWLTQPVRLLGDDEGWVSGLECLRMELGEPDESGRARPVPVPGSEFELEANLVVIALGTNPNPLIPQTTTGLRNRRSRLRRRRRVHGGDEPGWHLCRRRHRDGRGDRDPGNGRRAAGRHGDPRVPAGARLENCSAFDPAQQDSRRPLRVGERRGDGGGDRNRDRRAGEEEDPADTHASTVCRS